MKYIHTSKGISLIETLLAIGIMSILVLSASSLFVHLSKVQKESRTTTTLEAEASFIMNEITRSLRNAESVVYPDIGDTDDMIELRLVDEVGGVLASKFYLSENSIVASFDGAPDQQISTQSTTVLNITFQNTSTAEAESIRVVLTMSAGAGGISEEDYEVTLYSSVTLR